MKMTTAEKLSIAAAVIFIASAVGFYAGRMRTDAEFTVEKQKTEITVQVPDSSGPPSDDGAGETDAVPLREKSVNINTADTGQLAALPSVGEALAGRIVEYREENGEFKSVDEIMDVRGIGEGIYNKIEQYITVE